MLQQSKQDNSDISSVTTTHNVKQTLPKDLKEDNLAVAKRCFESRDVKTVVGIRQHLNPSLIENLSP